MDQRLVEQPGALDVALREAGALGVGQSLRWLSPLRDDKWAEYRDKEFLARIGYASLAQALKEFWPRRGPQWDALAHDESGRVFIIEAKARGREMSSSCQAGPVSRRLIEKSLAAAKQEFGVQSSADWLNGYYQYANRLAHLSFLRRNNVDAWLVFLYFTGDQDIKGPASEAEWKAHIDQAHAHLGLIKKTPGVVSLFYPVGGL